MSFLPELGSHYPERAAAVGLRHEDVVEKFILGSGHGGQNRNKRSTAVQLIHHLSGIEIRSFHKRMQHQNRMDAWEHLLLLLEERQRKTQQAAMHEKFTLRAQRRRRTRGGQHKVLQAKKVRAETKKNRQQLPL